MQCTVLEIFALHTHPLTLGCASASSTSLPEWERGNEECGGTRRPPGRKLFEKNRTHSNHLTRKNIRRKFAAKVRYLFKNFFESTFPAIARGRLRRHVGCFPAKERALGRETGRHRHRVEDAAILCRRAGRICAQASPASCDRIGVFARQRTPCVVFAKRCGRPPVISCYDFGKAAVCLEIPADNRRNFFRAKWLAARRSRRHERKAIRRAEKPCSKRSSV